ncbi:MAG TPA: DUF3754 domain-containing protein [Gemmatales bacterium]|nr:DUF3754 domain-containing protein [Gemmatales bacterium]
MAVTSLERPRDKFVPLSRAALLELLPRLDPLSEEEQAGFVRFADRLAAQLHQDFHSQLRELKSAYTPFDPDCDDHAIRTWSAAQRDEELDQFFSRIAWLLQRANYVRLDRHDVEEACRLVSDWGINMEVDFSVFDRWLIFARGDRVEKRPRRRWRKGWRTERAEVDVFSRMVIVLKLRRGGLQGPDVDTRHIFLKMFKNIPQMDLEMLLPGSRVRFSNFDRGKLGLSLLSGLVLAFWNVLKTTLLPLIGVGATVVAPGSMTLWWGLTAGTLGYGWRSFYSYNWTQTRYRLTLTSNLYYRNLDNNAGVLFRLVDEAEEQEGREALLAYWLLWRQGGEDGLVRCEIDRRIEALLHEQTGHHCDFEISDALAKLLRLGLIHEVAHEVYKALPLGTALEKLEERWRAELRPTGGSR